MVHALKEIWRVLAPGGLLLDVRPFSANMPVEVVGAAGAAMAAGEMHESEDGRADDQAANAAMRAIEREGLFAREREGTFDFLWYWDTPDEMQAYVAEKWTDTYLPDDVLAETRRLMQRTGADAQVRTSTNIIISRWRRLKE